MSSKPRESLFFRLLIVVSVAFLLTVLMMVASVFSPSQSAGGRFLNHYALQVIGVEVVLTILLAIVAMAADRRRTPTSSEPESTGTQLPQADDNQ